MQLLQRRPQQLWLQRYGAVVLFVSTGVEQDRTTGTPMLAKRILSDFMNSCGHILSPFGRK